MLREMQNKTTVSYYYISVRMENIKKYNAKHWCGCRVTGTIPSVRDAIFLTENNPDALPLMNG